MTDPRPFDPESILRVLEQCGVDYVLIGGLAASLHGSPHVTTDVDITPSTQPDNLERLAAALHALDARIRAEGEPGGIPFQPTAELLNRTEILTLTTRYGDLDVTNLPTGTRGYEDLRKGAIELTVHGTKVTVAALADIVRSKEAAGRAKDQLTLPTLRALMERIEE